MGLLFHVYSVIEQQYAANSQPLPVFTFDMQLLDQMLLGWHEDPILFNEFYIYFSNVMTIYPFNEYLRDLIALAVKFFRPIYAPDHFIKGILALMIRMNNNRDGRAITGAINKQMTFLPNTPYFVTEFLTVCVNPFEVQYLSRMQMYELNRLAYYAITILNTLFDYGGPKTQKLLLDNIPLESLINLAIVPHDKGRFLMPEILFTPLFDLLANVIVDNIRAIMTADRHLVDCVITVARTGRFTQRTSAIRFVNQVLNVSLDSNPTIPMYSGDELVFLVCDLIESEDVSILYESLTYLDLVLMKSHDRSIQITQTLPEGIIEFIDHVADDDSFPMQSREKASKVSGYVQLLQAQIINAE